MCPVRGYSLPCILPCYHFLAQPLFFTSSALDLQASSPPENLVSLYSSRRVVNSCTLFGTAMLC